MTGTETSNTHQRHSNMDATLVKVQIYENEGQGLQRRYNNMIIEAEDIQDNRYGILHSCTYFWMRDHGNNNSILYIRKEGALQIQKRFTT